MVTASLFETAASMQPTPQIWHLGAQKLSFRLTVRSAGAGGISSPS
jgi:hypothetical protein